MKILIINDNCVSQVNGVNTAFNKTVEILRQRGHIVEVIHPELFYFFSLSPFFPEVHIPFFSGSKIYKAIIKGKPDHIHIMTEGALGLKARLICIKKNIRFTTSYHTNFDIYLQERFNKFFCNMMKSYLHWFHSKAYATMVSTETLRKQLENNGYKNVVICPLGVDVDLFKKPEKEIISQYTRPIFTYLGRLAKEKNVTEFLECDLPGTKLIIGDGPQMNQLEEMHTKSTIFVGLKRGQELVDLLSQSDVLVFPSKTDTFGLTIVEALACGVPVAAHDVMGPQDIITNGIDGFMDENLEKASLECLKIDRTECRKKAMHFSWENSVDMFLKNLA